MNDHTKGNATLGVKGTRKHAGSCHCGAVRFSVEADLSEGASRCNCTICTKVGAIGKIVKPNQFALLSGEPSLSAYEWGAKISRRFFCKQCGIHCFARGHLKELGGDYVSVNLSCLDEVDLLEVAVTHWDGRHNNWAAGCRSTPWPLSAVTEGA
jgi:hypothetical protein